MTTATGIRVALVGFIDPGGQVSVGGANDTAKPRSSRLVPDGFDEIGPTKPFGVDRLEDRLEPPADDGLPPGRSPAAGCWPGTPAPTTGRGRSPCRRGNTIRLRRPRFGRIATSGDGWKTGRCGGHHRDGRGAHGSI